MCSCSIVANCHGTARKAPRWCASAIGGASYSRSSPFGQWSQDVPALGLLRPPWALAYTRLLEESFGD